MGKIIGRKLILLMILLIITSCIFPCNTFAATLEEMISQAEGFIQKGKEESDIGATEIAGEFVPLGQLLTLVGMGVMIGATTFLGIKYLTASPEGQAKLKEQLVGLVVAGIVIFGAYYIWSLALEIVSKFD